jgi:hypothetical protein
VHIGVLNSEHTREGHFDNRPRRSAAVRVSERRKGHILRPGLFLFVADPVPRNAQSGTHRLATNKFLQGRHEVLVLVTKVCSNGTKRGRRAAVAFESREHGHEPQTWSAEAGSWEWDPVTVAVAVGAVTV